MALAVTRMYFTSPSMMALTRCRFGRKRRFTTLVTCMPMPPLFWAFSLRLANRGGGYLAVAGLAWGRKTLAKVFWMANCASSNRV